MSGIPIRLCGGVVQKFHPLKLNVDLLRLDVDLLRLDVDPLKLDVDLLKLNFKIYTSN
jgi:hypothetical protein